MVKKLKYRVVVKGVTISKHSTKMLALRKASPIRGAVVKSIGTSTKRRQITSKSKRRSTRW
jgi:hypothetical protein